MPFGSGKRSRGKALRTKDGIGNNVKKKNNWVLKFNCAKLKSGLSCPSSSFAETDLPESSAVCDTCICTGYRTTEEHHLGAGVVFESEPPAEDTSKNEARNNQIIDLSKLYSDDVTAEDSDERARLERAREIIEGVDPPPGFQPGQRIQLVCPPDITLDNLTMLVQTHLGLQNGSLSGLSQIDVSLSPSVQRMVHTQVDYVHCLVPDLLQITACSFYWGKMDRYEAERLLEGCPEGTFLLRDSAQEEYLFSVSFRNFGRSVHARIQQWNHKFSFDAHDPGVFASPTVCGLIEHYKGATCNMFFEPMLTNPLHRNFPFPLQHLCRAAVCSKTNYDSINKLRLPKALKSYLKEYHYKQRVRVRRFDSEL
ncbi:UNVERIFIED_CONTAM: hypothetical protein PYX00_006141 [Menopon gallinae]|uniref:Suppressor of cytokine signaling 5 n=1 Tax=Menopon gallinae TaxID=328185 RepID=A0AAW2HUF9_9NEOP